MANNRMYLVNPETGVRIYVAKYFPSLGWYTVGDVEARLNDGFDESDFGHLTPEERAAKRAQLTFGPPYARGGSDGAQWVLEYE
jgi:hypothetical protein